MKLNSGTYGCIYKGENITCRNDPPNVPKDKYIAKVVEMKYSEMEFQIGQDIQNNIACYEYYFAPLEYKCQAEMKSLEENLLDDCSIVKKNTSQEIGIGKIRNIIARTPNQPATLKEIIQEWLQDPTANHFETRYLDTLQYLLKSIERLYKQGIIHNDLKENNILYDGMNECPIIIDFGMSMKIDAIQKIQFPIAQNKQVFFHNSVFFTSCFESFVLGNLKYWKPPPSPAPPRPPSTPFTNMFSSAPTATPSTLTQNIEKEQVKEWLYEYMNNDDKNHNIFIRLRNCPPSLENNLSGTTDPTPGSNDPTLVKNKTCNKSPALFNEEDIQTFRQNYEKKIDEWFSDGTTTQPQQTLFQTIFQEITEKIDVYALAITHLYLCHSISEMNEYPKIQQWTDHFKQMVLAQVPATVKAPTTAPPQKTMTVSEAFTTNPVEPTAPTAPTFTSLFSDTTVRK